MTAWFDATAMFWVFACCAVFVFALIIRKYRKGLKEARARILEGKKPE